MTDVDQHLDRHDAAHTGVLVPRSNVELAPSLELAAVEDSGAGGLVKLARTFVGAGEDALAQRRLCRVIDAHRGFAARAALRHCGDTPEAIAIATPPPTQWTCVLGQPARRPQGVSCP
jgi:hypothetical protein